MTSAMASGFTQRLWSTLGIAWRFCGVSMVPGRTQLTLIPSYEDKGVYPEQSLP
jgi:hypothetical protein